MATGVAYKVAFDVSLLIAEAAQEAGAGLMDAGQVAEGEGQQSAVVLGRSFIRTCQPLCTWQLTPAVCMETRGSAAPGVAWVAVDSGPAPPQVQAPVQ